MDNFNAVIAGIIAVITALGGSGLGVIIKQTLEAAKVRAEGKKISEDGHTETQRLLVEIQAGQTDIISKLQNENEQLRAENEELRKKNASLENKNERLTLAVGAKDKN